jgi:uncharacterized pyridoxal phosphate-containing UPF0001 family protein
MSIASNIAEVQERIAAAARRAGRRPEEIALMAVSKTFPPEAIREAYNAGQRLFGENRVQEFADKAGALRDLAGAEWHMIGHLQTNKAAKAAELFSAVDSLDSLRLAEKLNAAAQALGKRLPILIEINVGREEAKSGVAPSFEFAVRGADQRTFVIEAGTSDLAQILLAAERLEAVQFRGLMTIPPFTEDPQQARPYFRRLREIRDQIAARHIPAISLDVLSMGMSHDFEVAIEEGSTCVRVGTAIFGERSKH